MTKELEIVEKGKRRKELIEKQEKQRKMAITET